MAPKNIMKLHSAVLLLLTLSVIAVHCKPVQTAGEQASREIAVRKLLESRNYQFIPRSVQTQRGRSMPVSNYSLIIRQDTLISYLPYYGVAYTAQIGKSQGPLDFTATNIKYSSKTAKKGNTLITIIPTGKFTDTQALYLRVSSSGYASLNIRFNDRQPISFSGEISGNRGKR
jgi:hypothetical protein